MSKQFIGLNVCPYCRKTNKLEILDTRYEIEGDRNKATHRSPDKPDDLICQDYRCYDCNSDWTVEYRPVAYFKYEKHDSNLSDDFIDIPNPIEKVGNAMHTAIECKNLLAGLNGEQLTLEVIKNDLDYYNEHLQQVIDDTVQ